VLGSCLAALIALMLFCFSTAWMLVCFIAFLLFALCFLLDCERSGHTTACSPFKIASKTVCGASRMHEFTES